jgi:hypothetical protein
VEAGPPLLLLLLPETLERFALRDRVEPLLDAPGVVAADPPRMPLSVGLARVVARRQLKRMKLPGHARAVGVFAPPQLPLAAALVEREPDTDVWGLTAAITGADFLLDLSATADLRPAWQRMERLGIETGRLGSERLG